MRKIVVVPLLALAMALPAAAPALAAGSGARSEHSSADDRADGWSARSAEKSKGAGRKDGEHRAKPKRIRFIELGTVASVDEGAGSLTVTVRRGKLKALGVGVVKISVTAGTAIRRDGADAELADLVSGDRVVVEGVRTGTTLVASRVRARGVKPVEGDVPELPQPSATPTPTPVTPSPSPSPVTPSPSPSPVTPTPSPSATAAS